MPHPVARVRHGLPAFIAPHTGLVASFVSWLVFTRVFDVSDLAILPAATRGFLQVQPWWFAVALAGLGATLVADHVEAARRWRPFVHGIEWPLALLNLACIAWSIVAMYVMTLPRGIG